MKKLAILEDGRTVEFDVATRNKNSLNEYMQTKYKLLGFGTIKDYGKSYEIYSSKRIFDYELKTNDDKFYLWEKIK